MSHYLVIGSGLVGRLTAWRLLQAGHEVAILSKDDREGRDSAGYVAAGMVSPSSEAVGSEALVKTIGQRSYELWPRWLKDLPEPVFYQETGTLVVAYAGDQAEMSRFRRRADHVLGASEYIALDHDGISQREPELADTFDQAILFEQEAGLNNRQFYRHITALLEKNCEWYQCEAIEQLTKKNIDSLCQRYFGKPADHFDAVIDCRGNGARADLKQLRSVRGEVIRVHAPEVNLKHTVRLMHPRYPFYIAPRADHEYILGATMIESDDMSPVSLRSGLELMSALYSLHKGFAEARILEMSVHCRPGLPNNLPTIKQTEWGYHINGLYRHGYLFGPALVDDLLTLLAGNKQQVHFGALYGV
ncbi:FAD-dependent oxidoreductase [Methylophaga nitratireducenticrescens]|uniref:D-amino-acid oxidase n=1 Tax=Methylophaga nitratireducenticrescens TaxID=754476 RepID=I1XKK0_METNJ|nr:FAD-dependent oxidoreductase [Methylophaga nitratireducenticrescens]AFI84919.1 FAD-dependent oxidoreductase [Methylophaga nitratireducenticrescens]AUZ84932.1 FAD-dependent oxidoreductase [Methylophaga nitratireducenticrescens]